MEPEELKRIKQRFGIIGNSAALNRGIEIAAQVAATNLSVLITGESGTGKEFFPKIIHECSTRKFAPYFAINCGAIPQGTIESELFGHEKGAFTDARAERKGYFEIANKGTLFLDEIGELPLSTQALLLRVLETGDFMRVGSSTTLKADVRVIAATNKNLREAVAQGKFREDLYYRLNAVEIPIPALRERKEDIPLLFRKFARDFSDENRMPEIRLTEDAVAFVKNYMWRGNIRQLKNTVNGLSALSQTREITTEMLRNYLPKEEASNVPVRVGDANLGMTELEQYLYKAVLTLRERVEMLEAKLAVSNHTETSDRTFISKPGDSTHEEPIQEAETVDVTDTPQEKQTTTIVSESQPKEMEETADAQNAKLTLQEMEKQRIIEALERNGFNKTKTAKELGMPERTLYRRISKFEIVEPKKSK